LAAKCVVPWKWRLIFIELRFEILKQPVHIKEKQSSIALILGERERKSFSGDEPSEWVSH
jgi:hypothetical protein